MENTTMLLDIERKRVTMRYPAWLISKYVWNGGEACVPGIPFTDPRVHDLSSVDFSGQRGS